MFMQDDLYSAIRFLTPGLVRDATFLKKTLYSIEEHDSHFFFMLSTLRTYYHNIVDTVLSSQHSSTAKDATFSIFISIIVLSVLVFHSFVSSKISRWYWNCFNIL